MQHQLTLQSGLPFLSEIAVTYRGQSVTIPNILVDTGSGGTLVETDWLIPVGILEEDPLDRWVRVVGIGGAESLREKQVTITVGSTTVTDAAIQIGALDYGYGINGIIGFNLLMALGAVLDCSTLILTIPD